jgi:hypothetical protein
MAIPIREPFFAYVLVPGPGTKHALSQFEATSRDVSDGFLTNPGPHRQGRRHFARTHP